MSEIELPEIELLGPNETINLTQTEVITYLGKLHSDQQEVKQYLMKGFIGLGRQNEELRQELKKANAELDWMAKEREEKKIRKQARAKRKKLPKRDPLTDKIYQKLIKAAEGPGYRNARLRIAFCIMAVTGIRINELLPLKVHQLENLIQFGWIAINRSKRGPSNHKAFLTKEGKKIVKDRQIDFNLMFLMKEPDSYVFTSEYRHSEMLRRETLTKEVNRFMHAVSNQLSEKPNITSHSFRVGYITQLWRDIKDIEFVKQTIGHQKLDTTSSYVQKLSDEERKNRIDSI